MQIFISNSVFESDTLEECLVHSLILREATGGIGAIIKLNLISLLTKYKQGLPIKAAEEFLKKSAIPVYGNSTKIDHYIFSITNNRIDFSKFSRVLLFEDIFYFLFIDSRECGVYSAQRGDAALNSVVITEKTKSFICFANIYNFIYNIFIDNNNKININYSAYGYARVGALIQTKKEETKKEETKKLKINVKPLRNKRKKTPSEAIELVNYLIEKLRESGARHFPKKAKVKEISIAKRLVTKSAVSFDDWINVIDYSFSDPWLSTHRCFSLLDIEKNYLQWEIQKNKRFDKGYRIKPRDVSEAETLDLWKQQGKVK